MHNYDIGDFEADDLELFEDVDADLDEGIEGLQVLLWLYAEQSDEIDTLTDSVGRVIEGEQTQEDIERIDDALTALQEGFAEKSENE